MQRSREDSHTSGAVDRNPQAGPGPRDPVRPLHPESLTHRSERIHPSFVRIGSPMFLKHLFLTALAAMAAYAADPFVGKWELNTKDSRCTAMSNLGPDTLTITAAGKTLLISSEKPGLAGAPQTQTQTWHLDRAPRTETEAPRGPRTNFYEQLSTERVGERHVRQTYHKGDKPVGTGDFIVAHDGATMKVNRTTPGGHEDRFIYTRSKT